MEKPISVKRVEFMNMLSQAINLSELPPCIVADVLQLVLTQVSELARQQLEKDKQEWEKELSERRKNGEEEDED